MKTHRVLNQKMECRWRSAEAAVCVIIIVLLIAFVVMMGGCMKEARYCEYDPNTGKITKRISLFKMGMDTEIKGFSVDVKPDGAKVKFDSLNENTSEALVNTTEAAKNVSEALLKAGKL